MTVIGFFTDCHSRTFYAANLLKLFQKKVIRELFFFQVAPLLQTMPHTSTMATTTEGAISGGYTLDELKLQFGLVDYSMFIAMMLMSTLIGVYYGFFKKQDTVSEYLLGGQTMGVFPIAMSLIAR